MSSIAASGAAWPAFGTNSSDIARTLLGAQIIPAGDARRLGGREIPASTTSPENGLGDGPVNIYSPSCPDVVLHWSMELLGEAGSEYRENRVAHRTLRSCRDATVTENTAQGRSPQPFDASTFFPFWFDIEVRTGFDEDPPEWWDLRADYAWAVRHVFTPLGASTYLEFHTTHDVWGSLPDSPEIFRLPDDFTTVESDAWSLFDRPAPTPEDPR